MDIPALQRRFASALRPLASAYGTAMRFRASRYRSRLLSRPYRAACPVVSVGNISWGGTGKTPVIDYLLRKTAEAGLKTVVLTRGYKASPPELPFPVHHDAPPASAGDEPLWLARRHPDTLVLVDPQRSRAAAWAEKNASPRIFLLDDGMQHLAVERDLDLVLLTPDDLLGGWNKVIPAGIWREDASALGRADAFCMKADAAILPGIIPVAEKRLAPYNRPLFFFNLVPTGLTRLTVDSKKPPETIADLGDSPYVLMCGTGNPEQVRGTASDLLGRPPSDSVIVRDHHRYSEADIKKARKQGCSVVCTAKDAVKLAPLLPFFDTIPVWVLEVRVVFTHALFTDMTFDAWWDDNLRRLLSLRFS